MKKYRLIIFLSLSLIFIDGCSMIKKFLPNKRDANEDISYELIENLSVAFNEGKLQALEEMIAIYNDTNQPFDVRMAAGKALAKTQHPTALNALSEIVGDASALDISFMIASIELLAEFKDDPRAADAMVNAKNNFNRTEKLLTETLGALGTDEVVPILTQISRDPNVNLGIRNRALEILGKKDPTQVADAFAELLNDPETNFEVREFALNTMKGIKEENLILALLNTYRSGKDEYYNMLNTLLEALGEFDDPAIRRAVKEVAMNNEYPLKIRIKAIEKLADVSDQSVIPSIMPILSDYKQYKLHQAVIATIKKLGQYDNYEEEIRRRIFEAHQDASSLNE